MTDLVYNSLTFATNIKMTPLFVQSFYKQIICHLIH